MALDLGTVRYASNALNANSRLNSKFRSAADSLHSILESGAPLISDYLGDERDRPNSLAYSQNRSSLANEMKAAYSALTAPSATPVLGFSWVAFILGPDSIPWQYIVQCNTAPRSYESKGVFRAGSHSYYANKYMTSDFSMQFVTDIAGDVTDTISTWMDGPLGPDGFWRLPVAYKRDIVVCLLDSKNKQIFTMTHRGCWAKSHDSYQLDNSSNVLLSQVTFSCDGVENGQLPLGNSFTDTPANDIDLSVNPI